MKLKHLLMLVGLLAVVTILQGCMARVEISLKDITVGEDITDDVKIEKDEVKKKADYQKHIDDISKIEDEKERLDRLAESFNEKEIEAEQPDEFEVEINKNDYPFLETEGCWEDLIYTVGTWAKDRDCLHNIAIKVFGNANRWPEIYQSNSHQIENPDLIYPGQKFKIKIL